MKFTSKNIFKWSLLILLVLNSIISCKKIDLNSSEVIENNSELKERFFNTSTTNDVEIKKLVNDLRMKDSIFKFLPDFVSKNGMPKWDKVLYKVNKKTKGANNFQGGGSNLETSGTQGLFLIPFQSQNSPRIQSYITAYKHNDSLYTYRLYNKDTLNSLQPTTNSAKKDLMNSQAILGHFEKTVNNIDSIIIPRTSNSNFVLKNVNLGFTETNNSSFTNNNPQSAWVCIYTTTIYLSYTTIIYIGNGVFGGYFSGTIYMTTEVDCYDDGQPEPGSGSGWNPGNPNNGSSGNGNGSSWPTGGGYQGSGGGGPFYPWWGGYDPNGGGSGGGFTPVVTSLTSALGLSNEQSIWLEQNPEHANNLLNYLQTSTNTQATAFSIKHLNLLMSSDLFGDFSYALLVYMHSINGNPQLMWWEDNTYLLPYGGLSFGEWAMNYLVQNPNVGFAIFKNQFMTKKEGQDGNYDASYWDNPSLTFPPQTLPSWSNFNSNYPKHDDPLLDEPVEVYTAIGGQVLAAYNSNPDNYQNTCALRISKALNYSGVTIPAGVGRYQGTDGKYYFLSAAALKKWMILTFGMPTGTNKITGAQGGVNGVNFLTLLAGKKGIYVMTPNYPGGSPTATNPLGTGFCASGHADMIDNSICDGGCYF